MPMFISEERIDAIFAAMNGYVLELKNDPGALGPQYFQDIIATCRNFQNRVSLVSTEINRDRLTVSGQLRGFEAAYALAYDDLMANDAQVKVLANVEDRKATASYLLRDQKKVINELKDQMHILDSVYKVISHRNRELHATMLAIKDQRRLMQTELATGAFYGDERSKGQPDSGMDEAELAALLADNTPEQESGFENKLEGLEPSEKVVFEVTPPVEPQVAKKKPLEPTNQEVTEGDVLQFLSDSLIPEPVKESTLSGTSEVDIDFLEKMGLSL